MGKITTMLTKSNSPHSPTLRVTDRTAGPNAAHCAHKLIPRSYYVFNFLHDDWRLACGDNTRDQGSVLFSCFLSSVLKWLWSV